MSFFNILNTGELLPGIIMTHAIWDFKLLGILLSIKLKQIKGTQVRSLNDLY